MADVYYPGIAAGDAASITATGVVEAIVTPNASYQVFELADTTFTTPLTIKSPAGLTDTKVPVGALPIFPDVYVVSPNFAHNWKSGDLVFRRDSADAKDKAVADAVAAAQAAVDAVPTEIQKAVDAGDFTGPPGKDGSNVVPTAQAVASEIQTPGTPARTALDGIFAPATGSAEYVAKAELPTEKILVLGTSIAAAYGATSAATAYPAMIGKYVTEALGETYTAVAAGVSSDTTAMMLARLPALLDAHKPAYVTIEASVNDSRVDKDISPPITVQKLRDTIAKVRLAKATPILITAGWFDPVVFNSASYSAASVIKAEVTNALVRALGVELNVPVVDIWNTMPKTTAMLADGLHPNNAGHALWGKAIATAITQSPRLPTNAFVYDDFQRADSSTTLGSAIIGGVWEPAVGTWGVTSGGARSVSGVDDDIALINAGVANVAVNTICKKGSSNFDVGLVVRATDKDNLYLARYPENGSTILYKKVAGVYTSIGTATGPALYSGDNVTLKANGSTLTLARNGTTVLTVTDTTHPTATKIGMRWKVGTTQYWDAMWAVAP